MEINWPVLMDLIAKAVILGMIIHMGWAMDKLSDRVAALETAQAFAPTSQDAP